MFSVDQIIVSCFIIPSLQIIIPLLILLCFGLMFSTKVMLN